MRLLLSIDRQQDGAEAMDTAQLAARLAAKGAPVAGVALTGNPACLLLHLPLDHSYI